jgi:membrane protein implicated in regulation of membrane protease activity
MMFIRLGDVPPPLWSVVLCLCIGAWLIYSGSIRLGAVVIVSILLVSVYWRWFRS